MYLDHVSGNLEHLNVGDPVMVKTFYNEYEGEVVKKGTKNLTVAYGEKPKYGDRRQDVVKRSTGRYADGGSGVQVFSREQWEQNIRISRVKDGLREVGIDLRTSHKLTPDIMEKVLDLVTREMS